MNRKNKKAFNLPKEHRLRGQISDFLLMLNTPEKVDLVRCLTSTEAKDRKDVVLRTFGEKVVFVHYFNLLNTIFVYSRTGFALNRLEDEVNDLIANAGKRGE